MHKSEDNDDSGNSDNCENGDDDCGYMIMVVVAYFQTLLTTT